MITLRDYQEDLFQKIHAAFKRGVKNPLVVSPTGSGKTILFSYITYRVQQAGKRVICMAHRKELVSQTSATFTKFGIDHGIIQTGITPNFSHKAQIAMVQTLAKRLDKTPPPDLIICDESHHMAAESYKSIIRAFPNARVLGVTATPVRLDGRGLSDYFSEIILGPSVLELTKRGFLSPCKYYAPPVNIDFSGLKKCGGDWAKDQQAAMVDKASITGCVISHYANLCKGMPAIAFCVTVDHAMHVADQFNSNGIKAATIHANMTNDERKKIVSDLGSGKISVMTNCEIASEGFDCPVVGAALLLRKTDSLSLHLQQLGRILRPYDGKEHSIVLDHVGNVLRHGMAHDSREWSLDGVAKKTKGDDDKPNPYTQCKSCYAMFPRIELTCPECGYYDEKKAREIQQVEGELVEIKRIEKTPLTILMKDVKTRDDLKRIAKVKGYKPGFVYYKAKELNL